jgi:hypothetical protein
MNRLLMAYLERLAGAVQELELPSGEKVNRCIYSPHSLRATTATLLLDNKEPIESVQEPRNCSTTSTSRQRRFTISGDGASKFQRATRCRSRSSGSGAFAA